ncbi:flagellar assembly protein FliW [Arcobacter lacus]|uniref:flagellar assembly protein FliW n=1 Tax=Arcobacter lacus TaxID=1912876 RepID=UPI0021BAE51C|nr:flagellar assembly protein FliW [Arcobacter lacus]MCT7907978.1 flagellar assembly protein FliW [Arcobacter lacus]MCT7911472.1 flagellar assembly protein FliW [Arcobacter lacus]
MYKVVLPILGFEDIKTLKIEKLDDLISFLVLDDKTRISVVNIDGLNKVSFDFQIDKDVLEKLKINSREDFDIYFSVVSQNPVEYSIINLVSPIFINEKEKLIGQYVTSEKVEPYLASINKCSTIQ